ncbi:hypothetical protein GUITHDRAFT_120758 [Guillardia theta CCMP2712]|uniref:Uncharacterized protein n=1 Tax=Guillardia theta (strain CCMP2712) TaxID=905079 RepID=L1IAW9_GUITC|nr:hypothetical protein GUITHDRAFT_120758 [Guillardia theta CCMP2712]EKX33064.1 hypothetical protein GUITHDRAFT_120758 [Guillardia theta CCMP2712]|eukprot:XP_005820044.1 hypothetical protein GUITHDRAFT_120758 [Guillardia theta CCMP2712]
MEVWWTPSFRCSAIRLYPSRACRCQTAARSYSVTSRPSVLDSTWSSLALLIVSTSSAGTADMYLNDTIAGSYSNGQKTAPASASSSTTPAGGQNIGAIIGGVIGGVVGAALLGLLSYKLLAPKAVGKAVDEEMVPVYLPQAYPALDVQYAAAAPMPVGTPAYGQQPMAYGM